MSVVITRGTTRWDDEEKTLFIPLQDFLLSF